MQIGISTATLFGRLYNEDALYVLNELGAEVVEIFLETYSEYTESFARLLKSRLGVKRSGKIGGDNSDAFEKTPNELKVHSIHTLNTHFEPQLFSPCERTNDDATEIFTNCLKAGKILGAKNYTLHGKAKFKKGAKFDNYQELGLHAKRLCDISKNYGINLCVENVEWAFYDRPSFYKNIKKYAPELCACLDVKQARVSGYDYKDYLLEMGEGLKTVHLSDVDDLGNTALPTEKGNFNFKELFKMLKDIGFNGNCLIEVYKENYDNYDDLKNSLYYLRNIASSVF